MTRMGRISADISSWIRENPPNPSYPRSIIRHLREEEDDDPTLERSG